MWNFVSRKEEEARKKAEAEEQARKAEQRRREAEALRKLQERSKAPWAHAPPAAPPTPQASLADIQRLEREKKAVSLSIVDRFSRIRLTFPGRASSFFFFSRSVKLSNTKINPTGRTAAPAATATAAAGPTESGRGGSRGPTWFRETFAVQVGRESSSGQQREPGEEPREDPAGGAGKSRQSQGMRALT